MKSNKATQTTKNVPTLEEPSGSVGRNDLLTASVSRILERTKLIESKILSAFGCDTQDVSASGTATFSDANMDLHVQFRLARVVSAAVRDAEEEIAIELGRIANLVPHGKEGYSYRRARHIAGPPPLEVSPEDTSALIMQRPQRQQLLQYHNDSMQGAQELLDGLLENVQRRNKFQASIPQDDEMPTGSISNLGGRESHTERMQAFRSLTNTFGLTQNEQRIEPYNGGVKLTNTLRSNRAISYANVLQRLVQDEPHRTSHDTVL